jgi:hypothetical protein
VSRYGGAVGIQERCAQAMMMAMNLIPMSDICQQSSTEELI